MRIGIIGTGIVGRTLGARLVHAGHDVRLGSRTADNAHGTAWVQASGPRASLGTFADAAAFAEEVVFNCTAGTVSLDALRAAGEDALAGKILIDVSNPLDFSHGFPPTLAVCNTDSIGEQLQRAFPGTRVVKSLNTMTASVMVDPTLVPGPHDVFVCGDDADARARVAALLHEWFGWPPASVRDLGDIGAARGLEMILPLWLRLYTHLGHATLNFHVAIGDAPVP